MTDLSAPLMGRKARRLKALPLGRLKMRRLPLARIAFGAVALLIAGAVARIVLVDDPEGGRPDAVAIINNTHDTNSVAGANSTGPLTATITPGPELQAADQPEATPADPVASTPVDDPGAPLPDLMEETEFGSIPRIGTTGETPFAAYARPSETPASAAGKPMVAIVVTGLGLNLNGTLEAINKLPDDVTLAFAPYGKNLDRTVKAARAAGHELFLEVPLEPFDYPDNDPGPDTLLTGQAPRDNLNKLFNVMSKFGGYAGIINNMGARFTAAASDFGPVMEELGARGLGYVDDGSSNRSLAPQLAEANHVPFAKAGLEIDANPARAPILAQLAALEADARKNGSAIGVASGLPITIQTIAEWAKTLEDKGILIVPASALMQDDHA